jgi:hypothetical protein
MIRAKVPDKLRKVLTNLEVTAGPDGAVAWGDVTGKPSTFPPDAHGHTDVVPAGASGFMSGTDKSKLDGIATAATANASDASLRDRATHTGTQTASTISDFNTTARAQTEAELIAGTNVTITPAGSGATRTLTIAASGGGGGGGASPAVAWIM